MCEQYVARSDSPFRISDLWPFTERLERFGIAGFGWGVTWLDSDGSLHSHRDVRAFRDDPARDDIARNETTAILVHLRRPSKLSTIGIPDTQPFEDPEGRYSFSHNGDLARHAEWRPLYRGQGRIRGRADTEVGARWLEDAWRNDRHAAELLGSLHETFGGQANLAVLTSDGSAHHYAGNRENPVFTFSLGPVQVAATGLYSLDRSLFRFAAKEATDRRLVAVGATATLVSAPLDASRAVPEAARG
jgi:hypothetical protein